MSTPVIIGAGLTGLIAAHAWPKARLVERQPAPRASHAALLRFRTEAVANLTGIEFRPVQVHKGIWDGKEFVAPSIGIANRYAVKCSGRLDTGDRSIWKLETSTRFIAPEDFYEQLVAQVGGRVAWGFAERLPERSANVVSTIPLNVMAEGMGIEHDLKFERAPIVVTRYRVPRCDLFQTVYLPHNRHNCYRASITGSLLICEHAGRVAGNYLADVTRALGIDVDGLEAIGTVEQQFGKIANEHDDAGRKQVLFRLTSEHGIYSLGRFATWRNILLDDVVHDIAVIRGMMKTGSVYNTRLAAR